jgi:hypothetical protein
METTAELNEVDKIISFLNSKAKEKQREMSPKNDTHKRISFFFVTFLQEFNSVQPLVIFCSSSRPRSTQNGTLIFIHGPYFVSSSSACSSCAPNISEIDILLGGSAGGSMLLKVLLEGGGAAVEDAEEEEEEEEGFVAAASPAVILLLLPLLLLLLLPPSSSSIR